MSYGTLPLIAAATGCLGTDEPDDDTDGPDAGRDSYGVHVENGSQWPHTVTIEVEVVDSEDVIFEETVELEPGETHEWNGVVTEDVGHSVTASIDSEEAEISEASDDKWIRPGQERSPPDENLVVRIADVTLADGEQSIVLVTFPSHE